jgi:hypothetical protein
MPKLTLDASPDRFAASVPANAAPGASEMPGARRRISSDPAQSPEHGAHSVEQRAQLRERRATQLTADLQQIQAGVAFRSLAPGDAEPARPVCAWHRVCLGDVENDRLGGSVRLIDDVPAAATGGLA